MPPDNTVNGCPCVTAVIAPKTASSIPAKIFAFKRFGFCILFGLLLNYLRGHTGLSPDTLIGVFLAVSLALGSSLLMVLAARINIHILENVLFGSVLTVNGRDLAVLAIVTAFTLAALHRTYNRAMLASFHAPLAQARKLPVQ